MEIGDCCKIVYGEMRQQPVVMLCASPGSNISHRDLLYLFSCLSEQSTQPNTYRCVSDLMAIATESGLN